MATQKVSFTIRRPTPVSRAASSGPESDSGPSFKIPSLPRHLAGQGDSTPGSPLARSATSSPHPALVSDVRRYEPDSSDEDEVIEDELVSGFDKFGVQRANGEIKQKQSPLVIPALHNKDWRELARKRRGAAQFVPVSAKVETGADGSVGGQGTRDVINSGPVRSGLYLLKKESKVEEEEIALENIVDEDIKMEIVEESDDQKALRAVLAEANGTGNSASLVDIIPTPISEADALKQDVEDLPDVASLEDYARVPVHQFGAALLRGMGWKEGTAASRKPGKGLIQPYVPIARPALLGIGAKEQEVFDDGSKKKGGKARPERRYVPIVKKERERSLSPRRESAVSSRRNSRSPGPSGGRDRDRRRDSERRDRGYDRDRERRSDSDRSNGRRDRSRDSRKRRDY